MRVHACNNKLQVTPKPTPLLPPPQVLAFKSSILNFTLYSWEGYDHRYISCWLIHFTNLSLFLHCLEHNPSPFSWRHTFTLGRIMFLTRGSKRAGSVPLLIHENKISDPAERHSLGREESFSKFLSKECWTVPIDLASPLYSSEFFSELPGGLGEYTLQCPFYMWFWVWVCRKREFLSGPTGWRERL